MIAQIILNSHAKDLDRTFDYAIPIEMQEHIAIGSRVLVPFGRRKALEEGFVIDLKETSSYQTKEIIKIEEGIFFSEEQVVLAKWMAKRYFCSLADAIKLMLPPGTTTNILENRIKNKTANFVDLNKEIEEIEFEIENGKIKSEKQIRVLRFLIENGETDITDLALFTETSKAIIKTLEKNGYIDIQEKQVVRNPFMHKVIQRKEKLTFTKEQQAAYDEIEEMIEDHMQAEFLVFGVTGSRKDRNLYAGY